MTHIKLGDFLVLTPLLRSLQILYPESVVAVPNMLFSLYRDHKVLSRMIPQSQVLEYEHRHQPAVLNLSFPLIPNLKIPDHHFRMRPDCFIKPRHAFDCYYEALQDYFPLLTEKIDPKPFLDIHPSEEFFYYWRVKPFFYFTVHSGSDTPEKNWAAENFEEVIVRLLEKYPLLECLGIQGPVDMPLFTERPKPSRYRVIESDLKNISYLLSGSLFHIDNDTGIHHLAGACDVPSITIFGATGPGSWASVTDRNFIHWGAPHCPDPCGGGRLEKCENRVCLSSIKVEHLLPSAAQILSAYWHLDNTLASKV